MTRVTKNGRKHKKNGNDAFGKILKMGSNEKNKIITLAPNYMIHTHTHIEYQYSINQARKTTTTSKILIEI